MHRRFFMRVIYWENAFGPLSLLLQFYCSPCDRQLTLKLAETVKSADPHTQTTEWVDSLHFPKQHISLFIHRTQRHP